MCACDHLTQTRVTGTAELSGRKANLFQLVVGNSRAQREKTSTNQKQDEQFTNGARGLVNRKLACWLMQKWSMVNQKLNSEIRLHGA